MRKVNRNRAGRTATLARCGFIGLLAVLTLVAGCATGHKSGPEPVAPAAAPEIVPEVDPVVGGEATVTHFEGGREGFVISEQPDPDATWRGAFEQGVAMLKSKRYAEAVALLEPVVACSPGVTAPYIDLAIACRHAGKSEQAEKCLKKALELVPGHPVASNEYGLLLRRDGRFAEARAVYEQALAQFPEYLPLRRNLGILCDLYLGDQACALEQYGRYSEARPGDEEIKLWIADLNLRMGNL